VHSARVVSFQHAENTFPHNAPGGGVESCALRVATVACVRAPMSVQESWVTWIVARRR